LASGSSDARLAPAIEALGSAEPTLAWHKPARPRMEALDGLRGILALHVVVFHLLGPLPGPAATVERYAPILLQAWFPVDVFFVMSGFVMAYVYGATFAKEVTARDYYLFFAARVARLYPVHLFAMAILALGTLPFVYRQPDFLSPDGRYAWTAGLASLFMLHSPWIDHRTWNYPSWSISAEWHAYALFPFVAAFGWLRRPFVAIVGLVLCTAIPLVVYLQGTGPDPEPTNTPVVLLRVIPLFLAGMLVYALLEKGYFARIGTTTSLLVIGAIVVLLDLPSLHYLAVLLVPPLVVVALRNPAVRDVLSSRWLLFLGAISYSLYMTHAVVVIFGLGLWVRRIAPALGLDPKASDLAAWSVLALAAVGSLVLGWLTFRFVEVPGRRIIVRRMT
jgi:peptidoglycan/LPS O-acetylase OafA/YrhL